LLFLPAAIKTPSTASVSPETKFRATPPDGYGP
jgi:hypothetical protein